MKTNIPTFQGHYGIGAVVVMQDGSQVAIVAEKMATLERAFKRLVRKGCPSFDRTRAQRAALIPESVFRK